MQTSIKERKSCYDWYKKFCVIYSFGDGGTFSEKVPSEIFRPFYLEAK